MARCGPRAGCGSRSGCSPRTARPWWSSSSRWNGRGGAPATRVRLPADGACRTGPRDHREREGRARGVRLPRRRGDHRAAYPFEPSLDAWDRGPNRTAIVGLRFHKRILRLLLFLADPRPIGPGCEDAPAPGDAEALARSIRSDPDLEATAPVAVTIGGAPALQIDVMLAPRASSCAWSRPISLARAPSS